MDAAGRRARLFELFDEAVPLAGEARAALLAQVDIEDAELADRLARLLAADASLKATIDERAGAQAAAPGAAERRRLIELFNEACDLGDEAPALIERVRAEDAALADRLAALLAADRSSRFADSAPPPALVERVAGYRIVRLLGKGGMGVVYEAQQLRPSRRVAIKVIDVAGARSPGLVRRFELEADIVARLHHPGIAAIYEAGVDGGRPYFAMELVEGERLDRAAAGLDARARSTSSRGSATRCTTRTPGRHPPRPQARQHPRRRPAGEPKVLDFGVARLIDTPAEERATRPECSSARRPT